MTLPRRLDSILERAARQLVRLERGAVALVRRLYRALNLELFLAQLRVTLEKPSPQERMRDFQVLSSLLDAQLGTLTGVPQAVAAEVRSAALLGAQSVVSTLTAQLPALDIGDPFKVVPRWALEAMDGAQARFGMFWSREAPRFRTEVQGVVTEALSRGQTYIQAARALQERVDVSRSRAELITRNEVAHALEAGNARGAQEAEELGVVMAKVWVATRDSRTRDSHLKLNGKEVPMDEDFKPGLSRPHDPRAPASETVRCRCTLKYLVRGGPEP